MGRSSVAISIYLAVSWISLQVVQTIVESAVLPEWLPGLALVLLVIGLPVVFATAFVQEGASVFHGSGSDSAAEGEDSETAGGPTSGGAASPGGRSGRSALGDSDAAETRANEALRRLPVSADALNGTDILYEASSVFAGIGQSERALDLLEELFSGPSSYSGRFVALDPAFDPIRGEARYAALLGGS